MRVLFCTKTENMGLGHHHRCLALVKELEDQGGRAYLLSDRDESRAFSLVGNAERQEEVERCVSLFDPHNIRHRKLLFGATQLLRFFISLESL